MSERHGLLRVPRQVAGSPPAVTGLGKDNPNVVHVIMFHGQSNVTGVNGIPLQSDSQREAGTWSWNVGPRIVQPDAGDNEIDYRDLSALTSIVPLYERQQQAGGGSWSETGASGMLGRLKRMGVTNDLFALNMGRGGKTIDELKQGTVYWDFGKDALQKLVDLYALQGKQVVVTCCIWSQGTGDRDMAEAEYYNKFVQLTADFRADFEAITGQDYPIKFLVLQDGSDFGSQVPHATGESGQVNAQFKAAQDYPSLIKMHNGQYHKIHHPTDWLHMLGAAQLMSGEEYALAYYEWIWQEDDSAEVGLRPTHFELTGNNMGVYVYYAGNAGGLVLDTSWVNNPGNHGFVLRQTSALTPTVPISSVALDNANNRILITTNTNLSLFPNLHISYAWANGSNPGQPGPTTGPRGTVRDSIGIARLYEGEGQLNQPDPNLAALYHWMLRWKLPVSWNYPSGE